MKLVISKRSELEPHESSSNRARARLEHIYILNEPSSSLILFGSACFVYFPRCLLTLIHIYRILCSNLFWSEFWKASSTRFLLTQMSSAYLIGVSCILNALIVPLNICFSCEGNFFELRYICWLSEYVNCFLQKHNLLTETWWKLTMDVCGTLNIDFWF